MIIMIKSRKISIHRLIATTLFRVIKRWPDECGHLLYIYKKNIFIYKYILYIYIYIYIFSPQTEINGIFQLNCSILVLLFIQNINFITKHT